MCVIHLLRKYKLNIKKLYFQVNDIYGTFLNTLFEKYYYIKVSLFKHTLIIFIFKVVHLI